MDEEEKDNDSWDSLDWDWTEKKNKEEEDHSKRLTWMYDSLSTDLSTAQLTPMPMLPPPELVNPMYRMFFRAVSVGSVYLRIPKSGERGDPFIPTVRIPPMFFSYCRQPFFIRR